MRRLQGRCIIVGEGGLGAFLSDQLYIGQVVKLEMPAIPAIFATVRNTRGTEHGFEFLFSRDGQRSAVQAFCTMMAARVAATPRFSNSDLS